jgi:hypothetical protein
MANMGDLMSVFGTGMMDTIFWVAGAILFLAICGGLAFLFMTWKKYDITVRMYSRRKGGWKTWDDKGAFIKDKKTGDVYGFKLRREKDLLQPPPYNMLMTALKGNVIHMMQESTGEYYFLDMEVENSLEDGKGKILTGKLKVIEGDVQLWMVGMIEKIYALYQKKKAWEVWLPYAVISLSGMIAFLIIYFIVKKFDVLKDTASSLNDVANSLKETALVMKDMRTSGALIPS